MKDTALLIKAIGATNLLSISSMCLSLWLPSASALATIYGQKSEQWQDSKECQGEDLSLKLMLSQKSVYQSNYKCFLHCSKPQSMITNLHIVYCVLELVDTNISQTSVGVLSWSCDVKRTTFQRQALSFDIKKTLFLYQHRLFKTNKKKTSQRFSYCFLCYEGKHLIHYPYNQSIGGRGTCATEDKVEYQKTLCCFLLSVVIDVVITYPYLHGPVQ